jgi:hypothetical protein
VLANSNCHARILDLTTPLFVAINDTHKGVVTEVKRLCPWCTLDSETVDFSQTATSVPQLINSGLSKDPSINYVIPEADGPGLYAVPAVHAKKPSVKIIGHDGSAPNLAFMRQGLQAADDSYPPAGYIGYLENYVMLSAMAHVSPVPSGLFQDKLFTTQNLPSSNTQLFPELNGYQQAFEKTWAR